MTNESSDAYNALDLKAIAPRGRGIMSNNNGKKDIISPITTRTRNSKIVLSSAKRTFRPLQQQPLAQYPPPPFAVAVVKGLDDIGSSNDNKKEKLTMSRPESKVPRSKNLDLKEGKVSRRLLN
jgi:hypothetical protein